MNTLNQRLFVFAACLAAIVTPALAATGAAPTGTSAGISASIPEPTSVAMIAFAAITLLRRRMRR